MATIQKITPCLWFDMQIEEAIQFYTSVFKNSGIDQTTYYGKAGFEIHGMQEGTVLTIRFRIEGQEFVALNGGPAFKFNEAISFMVNCESQEEIDHYWDKLKEGGDPAAQVCGWLKDKYGVSWQIVPTVLARMLSDNDKGRSERVMSAVMGMKKLDIAELEKAYTGTTDYSELRPV